MGLPFDVLIIGCIFGAAAIIFGIRKSALRREIEESERRARRRIRAAKDTNNAGRRAFGLKEFDD